MIDLKIPKHIDTGGLDYIVTITDDIPDDAWGQVNHETQEIRIRKSLQPDQQVATFCHELFHIISEQYELNLSETKTDFAARGMFDFLRHNKIQV